MSKSQITSTVAISCNICGHVSLPSQAHSVLGTCGKCREMTHGECDSCGYYAMQDGDCLFCEFCRTEQATALLKEYGIIPVDDRAVNDYPCPFCGNDHYSCDERDRRIPCWKCGQVK